jgi:hypothetical protein
MIGQPAVVDMEPLRFSEKLRVLIACGVSIWLFHAVGGMVLQPGDPLASLSLLAHQHPFQAAVSAALLSGVVSVSAALIGPVRLTGFSCVAVAVGWAILAWSSGTMEYMLVYQGGEAASTRSAMFGKLAVETLFWAALAVEALFLEAWVKGWVHARQAPKAEGQPRQKACTESGPGRVRRGVIGAGLASFIAMVFISQVAARSPVAEISRGQVYFAVGVGFFLGVLVGFYFSYGAPAVYLVGGVCLAALLSYLWAVIDPQLSSSSGAYRNLLCVPPSVLVRPLPVEYVALGVIGSLTGSWSAGKVYTHETSEQ